MDFREAMHHADRMMIAQGREGKGFCGGIQCDDCELQTPSSECSGYHLLFGESNSIKNRTHFITAIEEWAKENPIITYKEKFKSMFPNGSVISIDMILDRWSVNTFFKVNHNAYWGDEYIAKKEEK